MCFNPRLTHKGTVEDGSILVVGFNNIIRADFGRKPGVGFKYSIWAGSDRKPGRKERCFVNLRRYATNAVDKAIAELKKAGVTQPSRIQWN